MISECKNKHILIYLFFYYQSHILDVSPEWSEENKNSNVHSRVKTSKFINKKEGETRLPGKYCNFILDTSIFVEK